MNVLKRMQAGRLVKRLLEAADASDPAMAEVRTQLVSLGGQAIKPILDSLEGQKARGVALEVLIELVKNDTLPVFIAALKSGEGAVAETATLVLSKATTYDAMQLLPLFSDTEISKARVEAILSERANSLAPHTLIELLPDIGRDARGSVMRLLDKRLDASIAPAVARLTTHSDWWMRQSMAKLLARIPGSVSVEALIGLLKDEVPAVRLVAVQSLGGLKAESSVKALCGCLGDADMKVQGAAIEALVAIGDVRAVKYLLEYLKHESEYVRRGAVEVLNQVVTTDAIKDLVSALRDEDWWVRVRAADALGTLGGDRVVEAVISLIDDPDDFVRRYVIEILNLVPDGRSVEPLIRALDDSDWWVRERAIDALGKVGDARAVYPLLSMLARDTRSIPLCTRALASIGDERAVDPLCRLATAESPEAREAATSAIEELAKQDISKEAKAQIASTLESLGVRAKGAGARVAHRAHGPEAGRSPVVQGPAIAGPTVTPVPSSGPPSAYVRRSNVDYSNLESGSMLKERWRVVRRIGGGGFGTVYLVQDVIVNEEMVLKVLSPHLSLDADMIKRFVQELKLTRRITHKNVIRIHDLVDLSGAHAISMEYFDGRDLGQLVREGGAISSARAVAIVSQVLEGLTVAHELGIYHRDIKPANILIGPDDTIKIVDFGLASVGTTTRSRLTQSGILIGTPEYISPEQITGKPIDGRADLYSLACVMYFLVSAREPFSGDTAVNIIFKHIEGQAESLTGTAGVPDALSDYIARVMSKDPDERPANAQEMLAGLERLREAA